MMSKIQFLFSGNLFATNELFKSFISNREARITVLCRQISTLVCLFVFLVEGAKQAMESTNLGLNPGFAMHHHLCDFVQIN